jgi:hypothetical protein
MNFKIILSSRWKNIIKNAVASGATKGIGALVNFAMVPLTIGYLGKEKYGLWMAISSMIAIFQMMDLGVGNGLISLVAREKTAHGLPSTRRIILAALLILLSIGGLFDLLALFGSHVINWGWLFNYQDPTLEPLVNKSIVVFVICFSLGLAFSVAHSARLGLQQGYKNGYFGAAGQLTNLAAVFLTIKSEGDLPALIFSSMIGTIFFNILNLWSLWTELPASKDAKKSACDYIKPILTKGSVFMWLQLVGFISYNLDNLIVAHYIDLNAVSQYSIAMKIFSVPSILLTLFFSGLWAAYADAKSTNDWEWISATFRKTIAYSTAGAILMSLLLAVTLPLTMGLLSKHTLEPELKLTLGMFFWGCLSALGGSTASLLNGLHELRIQTITATIACITNFGLSIVLAQKMGVSGPIWGSVLSLAITYPFLISRALKSTSRLGTEIR